MTSTSPLQFPSLSPCVFVVGPEAPHRGWIVEALGATYDVHCFSNASSLLTEIFRLPQPDLILMSWLSQDHSATVLNQLLEGHIGPPVIVLCNSDCLEDMGFAIKSGATGFLEMPVSREKLESVLSERLASAPAKNFFGADQPLETPLGDGLSFVRSNRQMQIIGANASLVAGSNIPVLILGESGTGKEVLARYIHAKSNRSHKVFLKVNCAAMPAELLESELYGHERGAFTGAVRSMIGKFETCDGGTIFLDEIGEMSGALQAKLLHVLQDGVYFRLGGRAALKSDVRIIAATNINVKSAIASKVFREDLYYRLSGYSVTIPPLRERREEIESFAGHFMKKAALRYERQPMAISGVMLDAFKRYDWPGNLRELENIISRYLVMGDQESIVAELGLHVVHSNAGNASAGLSGGVGLKQHMARLNRGAESATIAKVLEETKWNRRAAARKMKISYTSLLDKIRRYGLAPDTKSDLKSGRCPVVRAEGSSGPTLAVVNR